MSQITKTDSNSYSNNGQLLTHNKVITKPTPAVNNLSLHKLKKSVNGKITTETCNPPVINADDIYLHLNDTFNPLEGVTASNCTGQDITNLITITFNNVNTSKAGMYSVTYSVKDTYGQTTEKTITVKVCENIPCKQKLAYLLQSVALEEASLAKILDAEAEKIQKVKTLDLSIDEMLKINNSVRQTLDSVTDLEARLQMKIVLFKSRNYNENCCDDN